MITVSPIQTSSGELLGYRASGHSDFDLRGNDPVCASISTLFEVLAAGFEPLQKDQYSLDRDPDQPYWMIHLDPEYDASARDRVEPTLRAVYKVFQRIANKHNQTVSMENPLEITQLPKGGS